ncbi:hypothetical protein J1605_018491 [Eschrichtius robustus]|uniref:MHC class I-like antigen recognition-like domain-containing protein n=1 Tax=Eschrichtius robustus TaxID=9764 RepID=A0AB34HVG7_ESCRO|nr:hypothetical protein J1605_018491 [Eschrichtius robustus]
MAENLASDHWERYAQLLRGWQQTSKLELKRQQRHYNHSDTLSWMAMDNVVHITKWAWEASQHELQYQKNWLEEECIAWLKRFLEYGKGTLQRTESETMLLAMKAVGLIVLAIALSGVGVVAWQRRP